MDAPPLEPNELDAILSVLKLHDVEYFKDSRFTVRFAGPPIEEEEDEGISTDVRGFQAEPSSDDDIDDPEELDAQHRRAMGGPMPKLNPAGFKKG